MTVYEIPDLALVVLIGVSGSGKSTFAARHFGEFETLSSDTFRGWVSDDPNSQESTSDAFEVLEFVAAKRLRRGRLTVVDATNVQPAARKRLVALAREHDILPVAVVLDVPESVCSARNDARSDRTFGRDVIRRQHQQLTRSLRGLGKEGFRTVHILRGEDAVFEATFLRHPLRSDLRVERGPFDVIGDIHGCRSELETLLVKLGYTVDYGTDGRAVDAVPPEGRTAVFLGDYVDRGPDSVGVLRLVMGMVAAGHAIAVPGNHENKLVKALRGKKVTASHGLAETLEQIATESAEFRDSVVDFCDGLVAHLVLDDGKLVVAHAGLKEDYHNRRPAECEALRSTVKPPVKRTNSAYPFDTRGRRTTEDQHGPLRSHAGARGGMDQQHRVPRHRLCVRWIPHGSSIPGTRDRVGFGGAGLVRAGGTAGTADS